MGPDRRTHLRNIAIIVLLALIVWLLPGGAEASATVSNILGLIFAGGLLLFGYRLYMEHRETILGLTDRQRGIVYGSLAIGAVAIVGTSRWWATGGGALVWIACIAAAVFGLYSVWQAYRSY